MSETILFVIGLAASILLGFGVALFLRKPLDRLLIDLCGTADRAKFWTQLTVLSFILMASAMALTYRPEELLPPYYYLSGHLGRTLLGLLAATGFIALTLSRFVRRQQKIQMQAEGGK